MAFRQQRGAEEFSRPCIRFSVVAPMLYRCFGRTHHFPDRFAGFREVCSPFNRCALSDPSATSSCIKRSRTEDDRLSARLAKKNCEKMRGIPGDSDFISPLATQAL